MHPLEYVSRPSRALPSARPHRSDSIASAPRASPVSAWPAPSRDRIRRDLVSHCIQWPIAAGVAAARQTRTLHPPSGQASRADADGWPWGKEDCRSCGLDDQTGQVLLLRETPHQPRGTVMADVRSTLMQCESQQIEWRPRQTASDPRPDEKHASAL